AGQVSAGHSRNATRHTESRRAPDAGWSSRVPDAGWSSRQPQGTANNPPGPSKGKGKGKAEDLSSDSDLKPKSKAARRRNRWFAPNTTYDEGWSTDEDERNLNRMLGPSWTSRPGVVAPYDEPPPQGEPPTDMMVDEDPRGPSHTNTNPPSQRINFVDD
ncbi:hypothetical protein BJ138DRAFT_1119849, partial [Hygrophoropsis aurantiaca]